MGASLSRRGASPVEGAPEAPEATKRPRAASKEEVQFTRVLEDGHNVTAILAFAGYRNVLTLEALCPRARRLIRGARVELDVSNETNLVVAVKAAARAELFEARRAGAINADTRFHFSFAAADGRHCASDVVYRDDRALLLSPRARAPALVEGFRGADVDAARSACAVAAKERRRAALISLGVFEVDLSSRDAAGTAARQSLMLRSQGLTQGSPGTDAGGSEAAAPEDAAKLVDALGGPVLVPRRLQLAAGRRQISRQGQTHGTAAHLDKALKAAAHASAVLDEASLRRLVVHCFRIMTKDGLWISHSKQFFLAACGAAGISADAHVVWQELLSGILLPLSAEFAPERSGALLRADGDVREGDVAYVSIVDFLLPAVFAFAAVSLASDAAAVFSPSHSLSGMTFERFAIRQLKDRLVEVGWSIALAILDRLGVQRDGETSGEAGKQRVSEAVRSLLSEERVHALAAGDEVEVAEGGDPDPPRLSPIEWIRGTVVSIKETKKAVVRVGEEEKEVFLGSLRVIEERPCAAVVLLGHALVDHRNDIVMQILQSLHAPLSYVVGEPGKNISVRSDTRCTVLDHAIVSKNIVGIGLLWKACVPLPAEKGGTASAWKAVRGSSHSLESVTTDRLPCSPSERADLFSALRQGPGVLKSTSNSWRAFEDEDLQNEEFIEENPDVFACINGDLQGVRKALAQCRAGALRARLVSRPWQLLSSLWRAETSDDADPRDEAQSLYVITREYLLLFACKMGHDHLVPELLDHSTAAVDIMTPLIVALAEGHHRCVERLLASTGPTLEYFISASTPDAPAARTLLTYRVISVAIDVGNAAAIDLLRSVGVMLHSEFWNFTVLEIACRVGQDGCVRALLHDQAIFESVRNRRSDALYIAAHYGRASVLGVLLESFNLSHVKVDSTFSDPILVAAVSSKSLPTVELLLQQPDVDINHSREGGQTPLMVAARTLNFGAAAALLARGARVGEPRGPDAIFLDDTDYLLKNYGDDVCAAKDVLRLLLQERPHLVSNFLSYAVYHFNHLHEDLIEAFLEFGANASQTDSTGLTVLHALAYLATYFKESYVEQKRYLQCIDALVLHGADVSAKTTAPATDTNSSFYFLVDPACPLDAGMTPLDVAAKCGKPDRREAVTKYFAAAIRKRDAAAGRTPRVETGS
mmetsp:Transcript_17345/g.56502  ORF Transcript_17345/g.56502 Transcript_17345/m.56502 type:complete len:1161 (+) Transcript_17345:151-3633(+)